MSQKNINIGYQEFLKMIDILENKIREYLKDNVPFSCIVPIPRGGLVPSVYLSHRLDIPIDSSFTFPSRSTMGPSPPILIVDDVADTGKTLTSLCGNLRHNDKIASLVVKPLCTKYPDFYASIYDEWIIMPWEKKLN